jgi:serine-type D-Ala-D-Ala carboxypeptidase (penicillin-binding protein 5/6)
MSARLFCLLAMLLLGAAPVQAAAAFTTEAPIAYLIDMSSGAVLIDKNSSKKIPPASMTKMMTAYVIFDELATKRLELDQKFKVSKEAATEWSGKGSTMYLRAGQEVSVADLLRGLITVSGNDAAITLAEGLSGSEIEFVAKMNATARKLGMKDSRFGTANGWPDEGRTLVTARDLAILAQRTMADFPILYKMFYGKQKFTYNNITQPDRNPLLGRVAGADGLKTGHTDEAGYCFTGSAVQNGRRLVMVVAGLGSSDGRIEESIKIMNWGFDAWKSKALFAAGSNIARAKVQLGSQNYIDLIAPQKISVTLPKSGPVSKAAGYKLFVRYEEPIKAPFKKGDRLALLVTRFSDGSEQVTPLLAANDVGEAGFFGRALNGLKGLVGFDG